MKQYNVTLKTGKINYVHASSLKEAIIFSYSASYKNDESPDIETIENEHGDIYDNITVNILYHKQPK